MTISPRNRVSKAAKFLDENYPGWAYQIHLRDLDIDSCTNCILGQLFGDYDEGMAQLGLYDDESRYKEVTGIGEAFHSFVTSKRYDKLIEACRWEDADEVYQKDVEKVNELWRDEIRTRRGRSGTNRRRTVAA